MTRLVQLYTSHTHTHTPFSGFLIFLICAIDLIKSGQQQWDWFISNAQL